jgi:hypothetical protein
MTEAELQSAVVECAQLLGWRVAHFRPARTAHGWRTPVGADGAGFPDLVMVRDGSVLVVELKSATGQLTPEQRVWLAAFEAAAARHPSVRSFVWRPADWLDGTIEEALRS